MSTYFAILTAVGEAKRANAEILGTVVQITDMAVGDGNGATPVPNRLQTALVNEVRRAPINTLDNNPSDASQIIVEQVIPENVGGWWIREIGLYDADGDLVAVANAPATYKPALAEGSGRTQVVRMVLIWGSSAAIQLKIDPAVVLATRKYSDDGDALIVSTLNSHLIAADPHSQYVLKTNLQKGTHNTAVAEGTADAIECAFTPAITTDTAERIPEVTLSFKASAANTGAATTLDAGTGAFGMVKGAGLAIVAGDIHGAGAIVQVRGVRGANAAADKWVLLNPATGIASNGNVFRKNAIINGNFEIWQRNNSFAITTSGSNYTADRWLANIGTSGNNSTISRQAFTVGQGVVPNEPAYWLRYAVTAFVSGTPSLEQRIESVRTFAGKQVTLSFWAKADAARTVQASLNQVFGSGGSPSGGVNTAAGTFNLTTSWQQFSATVTVPSISGKTLGSNGDDYLQALFVLPGAVCTIDIAQVQVEANSSATAFDLTPPPQELALCQRYFISGVAPRARNTATATATVLGSVSFPVVMRASPTVTMNPAGSGPDTSAGKYGFSTQESVAASSTGTVFSYTASAEL